VLPPIGPYGRLARFVMQNKKQVWGILALIVLLAGVVGLPPKVSSNLLELMPENSASTKALKRLNEEEGGVNLLTLAFRSDNRELMNGFLDEMVSELEGMDSVAHAIHKLDPDLAYQVVLLQLSPSDVAELTVRLKGALALGPALNPIVTQRLMDMGPLTDRIANADGQSLLASSNDMGRIMVRPTGASNDQQFSIKLVNDVEALVERHMDKTDEVELVWMGGAYRHNVEDVRGIKQDIAKTSLASTFLVLATIAIAFRSLRATVLVFVPLVAANIINLGIVAIGMGALNTYTSFGNAILVGLGIAFAVHLVGRYREERLIGVPIEQAIELAWDRVGPPCTTAALTSAAGFLALAAADFRGFSQLGVLLATGLMICLFAMLVMLPLLLPWLDASAPAGSGNGRLEASSRPSSYRLAPMGLMIIVLATGFVGATKLPKIGWEYDISTLRRDGLAYSELSEAERILARESYSPVVVSYPDRRALTRDQSRINKMVEDQELRNVARAVSIESVLPTDQAERLSALKELRSLLDHPNLRYLPPPLVKKLLPLRDRQLRELTRDDLPPGLLTVLGAGDESKNRILVFPKGNMWDMREAERLSNELSDVLPDREMAGEYISVADMYRTVNRDMPIIAIMALLMVTALTAIDLRKMHWVAGAILTLIAGMVWSGAAVQSAGIKFSMLNIAGIPILLGIGVDVVIHLLHRLREEGPGGVRRALATTGVAALVATLISVLSFVSLLLAGNRGVRSLGLLVVIGLITIFIASAVVLPTAWAAGWKVTGRAPEDTGVRPRPE
jgi:uncharacterized protein